jgi:hypothetical protein
MFAETISIQILAAKLWLKEIEVLANIAAKN